MKGQVSNELLVVVGFILLILIPLLYVMFFKMDAIRTDLAMLQVHFSVARIAFLVNAVGYMGDGSAMITEIYIPETVESVSLGGSGGHAHEVVFTLLSAGEINEVVQPTVFPIEVSEDYSLAFEEEESGGGRYRLEMENEGGTVVLSPQPDPGNP
ncbi:hypothetical protein GF412_00760 [Candidatus Micrarchaeota archaeon]|nr:hypothetical protein [Candidatus Micrarchaeota archaeon]MBD3417504.1 hypothetical protein [Candidatus Micrarchaeota archaeon]